MSRTGTTLLAVLLLAVTAPAAEPNPNVRFGQPAPAKADSETSREAFLIDRPQYVLSYNAKTRTPNWVSWRLRKADIGNTPRSGFWPDPDLPAVDRG
jgi:endonuclease G, mitochondrial